MSECPNPIYLDLPTLDIVQQTFAEFSSPLGQEHKLRGGIAKEVIPYHTQTPATKGVYNYSDHYHVEMSFTPEQNRYVKMTIAGLNALTLGKALIPTHNPIPTLSERIKSIYAAQRGNIRYSEALLQATLGLYSQFKELYPTFMPALDVVFQVAGDEGTEVALQNSVGYLQDAIAGILTADNIQTFKATQQDKEKFIRRHPLKYPDPIEYEVWCSGEALARNIMQQAKLAAVDLGADEIVRKSYNASFDLDDITLHYPFQEKTNQHILQLLSNS